VERVSLDSSYSPLYATLIVFGVLLFGALLLFPNVGLRGLCCHTVRCLVVLKRTVLCGDRYSVTIIRNSIQLSVLFLKYMGMGIPNCICYQNNSLNFARLLAVNYNRKYYVNNAVDSLLQAYSP